MSKYDFGLDLEHENSLSLIIDMIRPNSEILEFGPANGRLTKYLNNKMHCKVDIVEIDEEAGKEASKYSQISFLGEVMGDIEKFEWLKNINNKKYDYIIFADVLEHLHNPKTVLENCNKVLKEDGSIIMSVPNIAHNSVIIDLINDEFKYNKIGLLDNTHISFFTYKSLVRMIEECGYSTTIEKATYNRVGENEIINNYNCISNLLEKGLKERDNANLYQFVFEIKKNSEVVKESLKLNSVNLDKYYELECYIKEREDDKFSEEKSVKKQIIPSEISINIDLSNFNEIDMLRIDPINTNCIVNIKQIFTIIDDSRVQLLIEETNGEKIEENLFLFSTNDPQIYISTKELNINNIYLNAEFIDYNISNIEKFDSLLHQITENKENIIKEKENIIECKEFLIQEKLEDVKNLNYELEQYKLRYNGIVCEKNKLNQELINVVNMYNEISNSTCWKLTKPIRKILDTVKNKD